MYNLKDLQRMNQEAGETGQLRNESSIQFALGIIRQKKSWLYELSYLVRSLLIDHPFVDGNKRTAYLLCTLYFEDHGKDYTDQQLVETILQITKKNTADINSIARRLYRC